MKVIAINGSPKPKGNTYLALKTVCDEKEYCKDVYPVPHPIDRAITNFIR